jgi:hypothetical protein
MGQRLNIEIRKDNEVLANAYYHWSGYTSSALELTDEILKNINNVNFDNNVVRAVKLLEVTGAGLTSSEIDNLSEDMKNINFKKPIDRNEGLIAISEKEIKDTQFWEEARVEIHLDTQNIILDLYWDIDEDAYIYEATIDYKKVSFEKFNLLKDEILENIKNKNYYFIYNNEKYGFIE